ncbi:MAG: transporter substrate-binding domain-containing protein, partial [Campylobacterota bacterium]|nr:transporter substrate-binding domain-containing protein [Campylobacterota bacterium]
MFIFTFFLLLSFAEASLDLTQKEQEWIVQNPTVTFTGDSNWLPYEAFDKEGNYIGIVSQHLQLIEKMTGLKFKPIIVSTWSEAQKCAMKGEAKIISGDSADTILNQKFNPVEAYSQNPIVIIMNMQHNYVEDLTQIRDKKIVIIKDYGYTADIYKEYPNIKFIEVQNIQEGLIGVSQGKYDAMLATMALASYTITEMNLHHLKVVGKSRVIMDLTLFVSKDEPILHSIINKSLQQITQKQKHVILQKWIKNKYVERVDYTIAFIIAFIIALFLAIIIAIILFWTFRLKKEVIKRRILQDKYKSQLELNKLYLNTADVLMVALDTQGRVTMINRKGKEILALEDEVIVGKSWFDLGFLPSDIEDNYRKVFSKIIAQDMHLSQKVEHPLISRKGECINLLWRNTLLIDREQRVHGTISSALDVTQKRIQEKITAFRYLLSEISHDRDIEALNSEVIKAITSILHSQEGFFESLDCSKDKDYSFRPTIDNHSSTKE